MTFLGTSAGTPTRTRNVTSQAVSFDHGPVWLLDCGEGTQHQLLRAGIRCGRIERILITHLHGDHCYGLPGLLSLLGIHQRVAPVHLVGPRGLREFITTTLRLSVAQLPFALEFTELDEAQTVVDDGRWSIRAQPLLHRVPCFGYVLNEAPRAGRFHPERALALGVAAGAQFGRLQRGEAVTLDDGRVVRSDAVTDPPRRGRKLVLLGDTSDASAIIADGSDCDVLVCEATYDAAREEKAIEWGHSTSAMTGALAGQMRAKNLIITHFSSRFTDSDADAGVAQLLKETQAACPATQVHAADDLWQFTVPDEATTDSSAAGT